MSVSTMIEYDLEGKLSDDVLKSIHNHKHNYADDFGYVMRSSLIRVRNRLLQSQSALTDTNLQEGLEAEGILLSDSDLKAFWRAYDLGVKAEALYGMLGKAFFGKSDSEQLLYIKHSLINAIYQNEEYIRTLIDPQTSILDKPLRERLQRALDMSLSLRERIDNIDNTNISVPAAIPLVNVIKEAFEYSNNHRDPGISPILDEYFIPDDLRSVSVFADRDLFRENILDNIIRNLNQHAFAGFDDVSNPESDHVNHKGKRPWWRGRRSFRPKWMSKSNNLSGAMSNDSKSHWWLSASDIYDDMPDYDDVPEKLVAVRFSRINDDHVEVIIENNGLPFTGDCESVFDRGVGSGTGIGLDCARRFVEENCSGTISMFISEGKYKVGFKITLPIYGNI